jgi:hypothetical protein
VFVNILVSGLALTKQFHSLALGHQDDNVLRGSRMYVEVNNIVSFCKFWYFCFELKLCNFSLALGHQDDNVLHGSRMYVEVNNIVSFCKF